MTKLDWYFDFISPFAYLQSERMDDLRAGHQVQPRPVLFAGLLNHWGQLGPAEIPTKRIFTYQHCLWLARREGLPLVTPAAHPFNPLPYLRLALALDCRWDAIQTIFRHIWQTGGDPADQAFFQKLAVKLEVADPVAAIGDPSVKAALKATTDEAIENGVFGVPTFLVDDFLFWGFDATGMVRDYLADPTWFRQSPFRDAANLPIAAARKKPT